MKLFSALSLSSQSRAEAYVYSTWSLLCFTFSKRDYRLVASHHPEREPGTGDVFRTSIYRVTYPNETSTSWGDSVVADKPHKTYQTKTFEEMVSHLEKAEIEVEKGWFPLEDEQIDKMYTDEPTGVRLRVESENPGYPGIPKLTLICPLDRVLPLEVINQARARLLEMAGLPVDAMPPVVLVEGTEEK